jgi:peptidoglycan/xylan/chitin deacetylase (PgdA/CDA1 family)
MKNIIKIVLAIAIFLGTCLVVPTISTDMGNMHYTLNNPQIASNNNDSTLIHKTSPQKNEIINLPVVNIPILMYHDVAPWTKFMTKLSKSLMVQPDEFNAQMDYLEKNNYTTITLKELNLVWEGKMVMPKNPIVLTFDDGDAGVYQYAYPILKKHNFKFVVFLITKFLRFNTNFYMKRSQVKEILNSGLCEAGSHTCDHINLQRASKDFAYYEISQSKKDIEKYLSFDATSFAYPGGRFSDEAIKDLKKNGYNIAVTTIYGFANENQNHLLLKRIRIDGREPISTFIAKLKGY